MAHLDGWGRPVEQTGLCRACGKPDAPVSAKTGRLLAHLRPVTPGLRYTTTCYWAGRKPA